MYRAHESDKEAVNAFREVEKKYRATLQQGIKKKKNNNNNNNKSKKSDFSDVIDFAKIQEGNPSIKKFDAKPIHSKYFGGVQSVYEVVDVPGLFFIPNPFTTNQQKYWIDKCMKQYTVGNPTNITNLNKNDPATEWNKEMMPQLRWTSLGYHFQWTQRIYTEEHRGPFPEELAELVSDLAGLVNLTITAEAAIINYYPHLKCQMGAHVDDAEDDMTKPIVSVSFGNSVVFLIGGRTRDVKPTPLFIHSGDVVILSGEARYCYHAVPRMIESSIPEALCKDNEQQWADCKEYITNARINMNCRQVKHMATASSTEQNVIKIT